MRRIIKWFFGGLLFLALVVVALGAPVLYVETSCQGEASPRPYQAFLPETHHRAETRTLLTYPEWHIVHAYEEYAEVIRTGAPHDFGFLSSIAGYWSTLCSVTEKASEHGIIDTPTKQLVYVIGTSFTAELALKALYEETLGRIFVLLRGDQHSSFDQLTAAHAKDYAEFLQQVPWYKWGFTQANAELQATPTQNLRDKERRFSIGLEYSAKAAYADVIAEAVASAGEDQLTLRMIVSPQSANRLVNDDNIKIMDQLPQGTVIETPRYRALTHLLIKMANDGHNFVEIAGNDQIMFTALSSAPDMPDAFASTKRQGFSDYRHLVIVEVSELAQRLRDAANAGMKIEHIHDY